MDSDDNAQEIREKEEAQTLFRARRKLGIANYQCDNCFTIIPEGRRKALPEARFCVSCQREREGGDVRA